MNITLTTKAGVYSPHSMNGVLVVDGIVVSAYGYWEGYGLLNMGRTLGISPTLFMHVRVSSPCAPQIIIQCHA